MQVSLERTLPPAIHGTDQGDFSHGRGYGFLWGDLADYTAGIGPGILVERVGPHDRIAPEA
jgi:hypothetical protein